MCRLLTRTRELLDESEVSLADLSIQTGLPYHWLSGLKYKKVNNPSINRVETLYVFLSGQPVGLDREPTNPGA